MQTYMPKRSQEAPANIAAQPAAQKAAASVPVSFGGGTTSSAFDLKTSMRTRLESRFGPDFYNAKAEAEADSIGSQFTGAQSFSQLKEQMGEQLGADFSQVHLHSGPEAAAMSSASGAQAFTSGRDIYVGSGGFDPFLTAHEMVHTVQQGAVDASANVTAAPEGAVQYREPTEEEIAAWSAAARAGDRSHLTDLAVLAPDVVQEIVNRHVANIRGIWGDPPGFQDRAGYRNLAGRMAPNTQAMMDPLFRHALSQGDTGMGRTARAVLGDEMDHMIIADSMKIIAPGDRERLNEDEANAAEQAGRNMAHQLLAMQLGKFTVQQDGQARGLSELAYNPSMAAMISHGGRVIMDFGMTREENGTDATDVYRSMLELDDEGEQGRSPLAHQVKQIRKAATHYLSSGPTGLQEEHGGGVWFKGLVDRSTKQRGYNPAIGGAGKVGIRSDAAGWAEPEQPSGHIIKADGVNGHMFTGVKNSSTSAHGGMMVGLETSATGQTNLLGKAHTAAAVKSFYSPTGALKGDSIGQEYGGRNVDLTRLSMDEQVELQHKFTQRLKDLEHNPAEYNSVMDSISGTQMDPEALAQMLSGANEGDDYNRMLGLVRRGRQII